MITTDRCDVEVAFETRNHKGHFIQERIAELQPLRGQCFSNFYLYLALKALEASQSRSSSLKAIRYLLQAVKYDPSLPRRRQFLTLLTLVKAFLGVLFSPQIARQQLSLIKKQRQVIAQ
ncbi:hypothetical protein [Leptolyngbya sp. 7M]|uniref:hypothetical protein n=1 Tax=Leptolyngbya sp. 7M TaxID=2812896 RepID=UPI001B8B78F3|nr:hypothetical protein [Leptolyngbya sp. 7M]QYO62090.1 hypothetical protein JVX88_18385 [Leptolyngbya sp. 7M]